MPSDDWLEDLVDLFVQEGLGVKASLVAGDFGIFRDGRPKDRQHRLIILSRTGGTPDSEIAELRPRTFQVLVIGDKTDPEPAVLKADEIYEKISHKRLTLTGGRTFDYFLPLQLPTLIGPDENQNLMWSNNYRTQNKEEVS